MFWTFVLFLIGFFVLIKGSNLLIKGSSSLARLWGISEWVIGVVIVGIGTSLPEFSINIASLFSGANVGIGTIIGSNTFNTLVILGLVALISPIKMKKTWVARDMVFNALAIVMAITLLFFPLLGDGDFRGITQLEGLALGIIFITWIWLMVDTRGQIKNHAGSEKIFTFSTSLLLVVAGIIGVFIGGRWVVNGAAEIARLIGISEALIGLTIVGIGTSMPELTVSITAALKKKTDLAIGNIIGSNIFDFIGILSMSAIIKPVIFPQELSLDIFITLATTLILLITMHTGRRHILERWEGVVFILLYIGYISLLFVRT